MTQYQEYFTIQRDEWKQVHISKIPLEQPLVEVWKNGLRQRRNVDYFRNADTTLFYFPFAYKGHVIEITYWA